MGDDPFTNGLSTLLSNARNDGLWRSEYSQTPMAPAAEATVHCLLFSACRSALAGPTNRAALRHPKIPVDEQPVIQPCPPWVGRPLRQQQGDSILLRLVQLVALDPHQPAPCSTRMLCISNETTPNPERRFSLGGPAHRLQLTAADKAVGLSEQLYSTCTQSTELEAA